MRSALYFNPGYYRDSIVSLPFRHCCKCLPSMIEFKERQKLFRVAEMVARARVHPAQLSKGQAAEFASIANTGLVVIQDDQIAFANPELFATWLSRYCAKSVSDVWEDLDQTAQELLRTYLLFRELELPRSATTGLFLSLENDCGRSVLARLEEAARLEVRANEPNVPLSSIYFNFCDALPELGYTSTDLANHLGPVLAATEHWLPRGKLQGAIERLAGRSQKQASTLLDTFLHRPEQRTVEFAANCLKSLWKFDQVRAHGKALELTKANLISLQRIGCIAFAWFDYELPSNEKELIATIDRLEELGETNETNLLSTIAQACGELLVALPQGSLLQRVQERFLRLASHKNPGVQSVIAQSLSRRVAELGDVDLLWDALNYLSSIPARCQGILQELDFTTYRMINHNPKRVAEHLENVVTSRPYGAEETNDRLPELYKDTVFCLVDKHQSVFETTITRWFASKDPRLHAAAADLVGHFVREKNHRPERTIQLDFAELNSLDESDVPRVICALTGYVDDHKVLASLLISVLSREIVSERVRELIVNALDQVVLYNMPDLEDEYLKDLTQDQDIPEHVRQVVTDALDLFGSYSAPLKERPYLKELIPPDNRVHHFRVNFQKEIDLYRERAFNKSGFLSLIPRVPVRYGRSSFSSDDGNAASCVPMRTFCTDIEIPREFLIDPLGHRVKRIKWRKMAVDGLPVESKSPPTDHRDEASNERAAEES